jgi:hypothetical protein
VFLHGDHATCLTNDVPPKPAPYANCPAANIVPNYKGYLYIQRRLATKGYISISIDGNSTLETSGYPQTYDNLVDAHLSLFSTWVNSAPSALQMWAARNADFNKVVLVGHSQGAASVNTTAYRNKLQQTSGTTVPTWRVAGQVLISGMGSPIASTLGVHTLVWASGCDKNNANSSLQNILDGDIHHDQATLRSLLLIRGANHNYSNSFWTDDDDNYGLDQPRPTSDIECRLKDENGQLIANPPVRLSASSQRTAVAAYVSAAVAAFASEDTNAWKAIDGTPGHLPSSGPAGATGPQIRVAGKGRRRNDIVQLAPDKLNISNTDNMVAGTCSGVASCLGTNVTGQQGILFMARQPLLASVTWAALGGQVSLSHQSTYEGGLLEVMFTRRQLGLRIAQMPSTGSTVMQPITVNVKLRDVGQHIIDLGNFTTNPLPTLSGIGTIWAQEVRLPVPVTAGFDYTSLVSVDLTPLAPASGRFWVADVFGYLPN